ncbi:KICSTOR complex protein szt2 [Nowakowskiella sp. JEL0078]|nr:KICSTOR complex protein szt2 [Nowakowskiella sp. JEL0078]
MCSKFKLEINITVVADFGSTLLRSNNMNQSTLDFSSESPLSVLMQDFPLTASNIQDAFTLLYIGICKYENLIVQARKKLTKESHDIKSKKHQPIEFVSSHHSTSSAGCLYDSLEYGLFQLDLLQKDKSQALIMITDGVSTGSGLPEAKYRDFCRRIAKKYTAFTVVQVGSSDGFSPNVNFGHVPDNEFLRFIAMATFGRFLYEADCPDIMEANNSG